MPDEIKELEKKICKDCNQEKYISDYNKAGGGKWPQPYCKPCDSIRKKKWYEANREKQRLKGKERYKKLIENDPDYHKKWYAVNREKSLERNKQQAKKYKDKINERNRNYRKLDKYKKKAAEGAIRRRSSDPEYSKKAYQRRKAYLERTGKKEEYLAKQRAFKAKYPDRYKNYQLSEWAKENRKVRNREWSKMKTETDIEYRIAKNIRSRTRLALKQWNTHKCASTEIMLGCTIAEFKDYFCSLFIDGMSWNEFMAGNIHIDHKKPCSKFDLSNPEEQMQCFHYSNLQPLWELDNLKKGAKYG